MLGTGYVPGPGTESVDCPGSCSILHVRARMVQIGSREQAMLMSRGPAVSGHQDGLMFPPILGLMRRAGEIVCSVRSPYSPLKEDRRIVPGLMYAR